jgi:4-amino-4-deoxy-L-arabinose transferase-like glycosyltransferase
VANGGQLYVDAWESKPPLFIYLYVAIIEVFGSGVLPLRIATALSALGTELALFAVASQFLTRRGALLAAAVLAVLLAVPFWEGNLAVADTFVILPSTLGVALFLRANRGDGSSSDGRAVGQSGNRAGATVTDWRWLVAAGALLGVAFLIRQTSAVVGLAAVLWLLVSGREWLRPALVIGLGASIVVLPVIGAFALLGSWYWFWDANVGFFFDYVPSGQELPFHHRPMIVMPVLVTLAALLWSRRHGEQPRWALAALWLALTLSAALLTGRPYSHYMLQIMPPLAFVAALMAPHLRLSWRPRFEHAAGLAVAGAFALLWAVIVTPAFQGNVAAMRYAKAEDYYANFALWAAGLRSDTSYNNYFDKRVNVLRRLETTLEQLGARDEKIYVWGELPWLYPLAEAEPATRYMTSFYVLLIPYVDMGLYFELDKANPRFIVVMSDVWPRTTDTSGALTWRFRNANRAVSRLIAHRYEQVAVVGRARVFERVAERPVVTEDIVWLEEDDEVSADSAQAH